MMNLSYILYVDTLFCKPLYKPRNLCSLSEQQRQSFVGRAVDYRCEDKWGRQA